MECLGGGLLTLAVISSVSLGFSTFLIGSGGTEAGPVSVTVGDIVYATTVSLPDFDFSIEGGTVEGPSYVVSSTQSEPVFVSGEREITVGAKVSHSAFEAIDFIDDVYLSIEFSILNGGNPSQNTIEGLRIELDRFPNYYFDVLPRNYSMNDRSKTYYFQLPLKSKNSVCLWSLVDMDSTYNLNSGSDKGKTLIDFSFALSEVSVDPSAFSNASFFASFSLSQAL